MLEPYPVVDVEEAIDPEAMGSKGKFWCLASGRRGKWLFKYPRKNTGEHWAEKVAAEVAGRLEIPHGRVELAIRDGSPGTVSESFVDESQGQELVHGNQALYETVLGYDRNMSRRQSDWLSSVLVDSGFGHRTFFEH